MPIFEYECALGHRVLDLVGVTADGVAPTLCDCGLVLSKVVSEAYQPAWNQDSKMTPEELVLHRRHAKDIEKAAANGTLLHYKKGRRTPADCQPSIEKALPNT